MASGEAREGAVRQLLAPDVEEVANEREWPGARRKPAVAVGQQLEDVGGDGDEQEHRHAHEEESHFCLIDWFCFSASRKAVYMKTNSLGMNL